MPEAGLEPARGKAPWDFKSHVSTSSTTPACGQIVGDGEKSRNTAEAGWSTERITYDSTQKFPSLRVRLSPRPLFQLSLTTAFTQLIQAAGKNDEEIRMKWPM